MQEPQPAASIPGGLENFDEIYERIKDRVNISYFAKQLQIPRASLQYRLRRGLRPEEKGDFRRVIDALIVDLRAISYALASQESDMRRAAPKKAASDENSNL